MSHALGSVYGWGSQLARIRSGLVLVSPKKITIEKSLRLGFSATNNEAEYEALLMEMMMVQKMGGKTVKVFSDSKLVVGQVRGDLEAQDPRMQEYLSQVRSIQTKFEVFDVSHVPRGGNTHADSLATLATSSMQDLPRVILVEDLCTPTLITPGYASNPPDQAKSELDGFHITILIKKIYCLKRSLKLKKYEKKLFGFGYPRIESYTSVLSLALICFVYIPRHQNHS